jgi:hypothetical protein
MGVVILISTCFAAGAVVVVVAVIVAVDVVVAVMVEVVVAVAVIVAVVVVVFEQPENAGIDAIIMSEIKRAKNTFNFMTVCF